MPARAALAPCLPALVVSSPDGRGGNRRRCKRPRRSAGGDPARRERLVQIGGVPGHLALDPGRRLEAPGLLLGSKLHLRNHEAPERTLVDIDLQLDAVLRHHMAALPQAAALGQRPEAIELLPAELDLHLLAREPGA